MDSLEELKLKTICEYLISERFNDVVGFPRFEKWLKPLFKNENIYLQKVFDFIVDVFKYTNKKRKYISYTRLNQAYLKYKEDQINNKIIEDISPFFDKLFNSILKIVDSGINSLGQSEEYNFYSSKFNNNKIFSLSRIVVICNEEKKILGLRMEYNDKKENIKMYTEKNVYKALDLQLESEVKDNQNIKNELRDGITHIFGTFNKTITSIGFKCISGKTMSFGKPEGEPFLFGSYGKKLQCIDLKTDENGISGLKVYFVENQLNNKNIKESDKDKIYYDEELLVKENDIKNYELIRRNQIIDKGVNDNENDIERFEEEDIYMKPVLTFIKSNKSMIYDNRVKKKSTSITSTVIMENKNYESYPNPFFPLEQNTDLMIPNPFYPEEAVKKKTELKTLIKGNPTLIRKSKNFSFDSKKKTSIRQIAHTSIRANKEKEKEKEKEINNKKNFLELKDKVMSHIYNKILKQTKLGKIDKETQIALDIIQEEEDEEDLNNKKDEKDKGIAEKEEDNEKEANKVEAAKFLCDKYGLDNNTIKDEVLTSLTNKEKKNKFLHLEKIDIKNFNKTNIITKEKNEEKFLGLINLFNYVNSCKGKEEPEKEKQEEEENAEEEEELSASEDDLSDDEEEEFDEDEEEEKITKIVQMNQDKADIQKNFAKEFDKFQLELEENKRKNEQKELEDLSKKEEEEKSNNIIKTLTFKRIDNEIKIFGDQEFEKESKIWTDPDFNRDKALGKRWKDNKRIIWKRPDEEKNYNIFRSNQPEEIIKQSKEIKGIKNGYFIAALGAICDKSKEGINELKKLFYTTEKTKEHIYGIYFYINGERQLILVDDYLPYDRNNNLIFYSLYAESELWISLIEKAWAKINGGYEKISTLSESNVFEALTGAYTKQIKVEKAKYNKDELWKTLCYSNEFPVCASTIKKGLFSFSNQFNKLGLKPETVYIIMKVFEDKETNNKKIMLRDPFYILNANNNNQINNLQNGKGIITISFANFIEHFDIIDISYFKNYDKDDKNDNNMKDKENDDDNEKEGNRENFVVISEEESLRCQFIEITNNQNKNEVFINLYQDNKLKPEFSYLMLIKKVDNPEEKKSNYIYIDSITSLKLRDYECHIALNKITLEKGTYYICCDVNYRFLNKTKNIDGYLLKIISQKKIIVKNVTEEIIKNEGMKIFQESLIKFVENKAGEDIKSDKNYTATYIRIFTGKEFFPFDIFYFHNIEENPVTIKFEINEDRKKIKAKYSIYNDEETSEFDNLLIKTLGPNQKKIIMIMNHKYSLVNDRNNQKFLKFEVDRARRMIFLHPVFDRDNEIKVKELKKKVKVYQWIINENLGFFMGVKNISGNGINLKLFLKNLFIINPKEWDYKDETSYRFSLTKGEKIIFSIRKILGNKEEYTRNLDIDK